MSTSTPQNQTEITTNSEPKAKTVSVWSCLLGAIFSGTMATLLYSLTSAIANNFASKSIASSNLTVIKITIAVRTLVVGIATLGTCIFAFTTVGLIALGIQILVKKLTSKSNS